MRGREGGLGEGRGGGYGDYGGWKEVVVEGGGSGEWVMKDVGGMNREGEVRRVVKLEVVDVGEE